MPQRNPTRSQLDEKGTSAHVNDFLGAVHVFSTMIDVLIEENLLRDASYGRVTPWQMKLLRLVSLDDSLTTGKAAATKTVDKLAKKAFLQRSSGQTDRREICLPLTDEGRRRATKNEEMVRRLNRR